MRTRLFWILAILILFGLAVLSSAGIIDAQKKFGSPYYYLYHQLLYGIIPGLIVGFVLSKIDYRIWKTLALPILFGALVLMTLVFVPSFGYGVKGATRWLNIKSFVFQPAEVLKLALIIYLAAWFGGRGERIKNWAYGLAPFVIVIGYVLILLALQPDFGTLMVVIVIALGMYFMAGIPLKQFLAVIVIGVILLAGLIVIEPYRFNRVKAFFNPSIDPRGISYQINQSLIAIGSGGLFGRGFGHSTQKFGFLPEVVGDSIFAIIGEELGLIGGVATILLYIALCLTLISAAKSTKDHFGSLFITGLNIWILSQAFINIAAISGLAPLTGIPLPFVSYGATATIALLASFGIVFNILK